MLSIKTQNIPSSKHVTSAFYEYYYLCTFLLSILSLAFSFFFLSVFSFSFYHFLYLFVLSALSIWPFFLDTVMHSCCISQTLQGKPQGVKRCLFLLLSQLGLTFINQVKKERALVIKVKGIWCRRIAKMFKLFLVIKQSQYISSWRKYLKRQEKN